MSHQSEQRPEPPQDWMGEHFIRAKPKTAEEKKRMAQMTAPARGANHAAKTRKKANRE